MIVYNRIKLENGVPRINAIDAPLSVTYELTLVCNMHCPFCYQGNGVEKRKHPPFNLVSAILNELQKNGILFVTFLGGEPLTYPKWRETLELSRKLGFHTSFVTNGELMTEETGKKMFTFIDNGMVSIHGNEKIHDSITNKQGSYDSAVKCIRIMSDIGFKTGVYFTATRHNYLGLLDVVDVLVNKHGVTLTIIAVNRFMPRGRGATVNREFSLECVDYLEVFKQMAEIEDRYGIRTELDVSYPLCQTDRPFHKYISPCNIGLSHIGIDPLGNVKLCPVMPHILGNIFDTPLSDIWKNSKLLNYYRSLDWLPALCRRCALLEECLGGCIACNQSSDIKPDIFCRPHASKSDALWG